MSGSAIPSHMCCRREFLSRMGMLTAAATLGAFSSKHGWSQQPRPDQTLTHKEFFRIYGTALPNYGERFDDPIRAAWNSEFIESALAVTVDAEYTEYREGFFEVPAYFDVPFLRCLIHETLHFWQALSLGFITNLAYIDWQRLQTFKNTRQLSGPNALRNSFVEPDPKLGFSVQDLSEALCRYWDVHIAHPKRAAQAGCDKHVPLSDEEILAPITARDFDPIMRHASYGKPYSLALDRWGSTASVLLFPLVGFFSLQTRQPLSVFPRAVEQLVPTASKLNGSIHTHWRELMETVAKVCGVASFGTGSDLTPGWDVMQRSELKDDPIWKSHLELCRTAGGTFGWKELSFAFATPGDTQSRARLLSFFWPAVVLFRNGRWFGQSAMEKLAQAKGDANITSASKLANLAEARIREYRQMREAEFRATLHG